MNKTLNNSKQIALINTVREASKKWVESFNNGDAAGCTNAYETNATMTVKPLGTFTGHTDIQQFWSSLIADGYRDVQYIDPDIHVIDDNTAVLSSKWSMNKAHGVITKELWVLQDNGEAKLRIDDFEILGNNTDND